MSRPNGPFSLISGILSVVIANVLIVLVSYIAVLAFGVSLYSSTGASIALFTAFVITQILFMLPIRNSLKRQGSVETAKGIVIGAILTALINGSCFIASVTSNQ
ncbi:MAG: hypothetical protein ACFB0D_15310 [Phormidesmis sp.]